MTSGSGSTDFELLDLAESVMLENGYDVRRELVENDTAILVENDDNIAIIAAPLSLDHLFHVEAFMSRFLTEKLLAGPPSRKRWDAFLVFLCAQVASAEEAEPMSEIVNNLRFARRLVRVGVVPTKAAVARALRPLLPLPTAAVDGLSDPLAELHRMLLDDGLEASTVDPIIDEFRLSLPENAAASDEWIDRIEPETEQ